jgi:phospholipase/carboxylesterase
MRIRTLLRLEAPRSGRKARTQPSYSRLEATPNFPSNASMLNTEFVAAAAPESKALLIVLHGLGDSSAGYHWVPEALDLPWMNYLLVNAPDSYYGGYSWYDFSGDESTGIERSRKLLLQLLAQCRQQGFPPEQTTLFGFSQGCLMTIDVGFRAPDRLAGLVGVSGYVHRPERLLQELSPVARTQRMLFTHGTADPMIPCSKVREVVKQLVAAGLNIEWREYHKGHTIAGEEEIGAIRNFIRAVEPK